MIKLNGKIGGQWSYDSEHKGAHYNYNGEYCNSGNHHEAQTRGNFGYGFYYDKDCTPFDKGSDIEELHMSVKSSKATLCSEKLGDSMEQVLRQYFKRTASLCWCWTVIIDENVICYIMNAIEFREFTRVWASYEPTRGVIRYKATSGKMMEWLEGRM